MSEVSQTREEAARQNALLSTGPRTEAGKAASAGNALKHGLRSKRVVLPDEDEAEYAELRAALAAEYAPAGKKEWDLVEAIAGLIWKQARAERLETSFWERGFQPDAEGRVSGNPLADMLIRHSKELSLLMRYQGKIARELARATAALEALQAARAQLEPPAGPGNQPPGKGAETAGDARAQGFQGTVQEQMAQLEAEVLRLEAQSARRAANGVAGGGAAGAQMAARNSMFIPAGGRR